MTGNFLRFENNTITGKDSSGVNMIISGSNNQLYDMVFQGNDVLEFYNANLWKLSHSKNGPKFGGVICLKNIIFRKNRISKGISRDLRLNYLLLILILC